MSDTPRTDNAAGHGTTVPADFAADVERELNAALAEVERLKKHVEHLAQCNNENALQLLFVTGERDEARAALKETK